MFSREPKRPGMELDGLGKRAERTRDAGFLSQLVTVGLIPVAVIGEGSIT